MEGKEANDKAILVRVPLNTWRSFRDLAAKRTIETRKSHTMQSMLLGMIENTVSADALIESPPLKIGAQIERQEDYAIQSAVAEGAIKMAVVARKANGQPVDGGESMLEALRVLLPAGEKAIIKRAAKLCGITTAEFVRSSSVNATKTPSAAATYQRSRWGDRLNREAIQVRISLEEKMAIVEASRLAGLSISDFARNASVSVAKVLLNPVQRVDMMMRQSLAKQPDWAAQLALSQELASNILGGKPCSAAD